MTGKSTRSYLKVAYDLRPSKQVERRMLLDFFRRMAGCGVPVESFRYTGMGSIHFIDHILFHKFLGIDKLVSVEHDAEIESRVHFNRPFSNVQLEIMEIGAYIPRLAKSEKHIVWLDYDSHLSEDLLSDVRSCSAFLPLESFILVTVDVEPLKQSRGSADNFEFYKKVAENLWNPSWVKNDFANSNLPLRVLELLARALREGVTGRPHLKALPCFSFVYSDGHKMVTLGVQLGGQSQEKNLQFIKNEGASYLVLSFDEPPFHIDVPVLTRRERLYLERLMPSRDYNKVQSAGVSEEDFIKFGEIYRFLPSYAELLLG